MSDLEDSDGSDLDLDASDDSNSEASNGSKDGTDGQSHRPEWADVMPMQYLGENMNTSRVWATQPVYGKTPALTAVPDQLGPMFRLLQIFPSTSPDTQIHGKLMVRPIFDPPPYRALSYSWGRDSTWTDTIIVNATPFPVSTNLQNALRRVRDHNERVNVWIDAICINQQNPLDKAAQVRMMAQIFNAADEVIIWLGITGDYEDMNERDFLWLLCQSKRPWWKRLWVVQECAYARACPVVLLGPRSMTLQEFTQRWTKAADYDDSDQCKLLRHHLPFLSTPLTAWKDQMENKHRAPLLQRLRDTAGRQCSAPHDKVYALLSLIEESEQIIPDYRKPITELATEVETLLRGQNTWDEERDEEVVQSLFLGTDSDDVTGEVRAVDDPLVHKILNGNVYTTALETSLVKATICNDVDAIRRLLTEAVTLDFHPRSAQYHVALYIAASRGQLEVMVSLLDAGADMSARSSHETPFGTMGFGHNASTALYGACASDFDCLAAVDLLIRRGAEINVSGGYYGSPLQAAIARDHGSVTRLLLQHGAKVNKLGGYFGSALQTAASVGNLETVCLLLDHGAHVNALGGHYGHALMAAKVSGHRKVVRLLLKRGARAILSRYKCAEMFRAATVEAQREIRQLLKQSAYIGAYQGILNDSMLEIAFRYWIKSIE